MSVQETNKFTGGEKKTKMKKMLKGISMDIELPKKRNGCASENCKGNIWKGT